MSQQIIEQVLAGLVPQIAAQIAAQLPQAAPPQAFAPPPQQYAPPPPQPMAQPQYAPPPPQPMAQPAGITPDAVQQLVVELINHPTAGEAYKQQLTAAMHACGLQSLTDARPDQVPELWNRFNAVKAGTYAQQYGGTPAPAPMAAPAQQYAPPPAQPAAPVSII